MSPEAIWLKKKRRKNENWRKQSTSFPQSYIPLLLHLADLTPVSVRGRGPPLRDVCFLSGLQRLTGVWNGIHREKKEGGGLRSWKYHVMGTNWDPFNLECFLCVCLLGVQLPIKGTTLASPAIRPWLYTQIWASMRKHSCLETYKERWMDR